MSETERYIDKAFVGEWGHFVRHFKILPRTIIFWSLTAEA